MDESERLDLTVQSTVDRRVQHQAARLLDSLRTPAGAERAGLLGEETLAGGDPSKIVYSLLLYERGSGANYLRVQTDTLASALAANESTMLDLGSTAKLRTIASYLELMAALHVRLVALPPERLRAVETHEDDALSRWAIDYLLGLPAAPLHDFLEAALERQYSASPDETFATGGAQQSFRNLDAADDLRVVTVRRAFRSSINLAFVRLMRDITKHIVHTSSRIAAADILGDFLHPARRTYLERHAHRDGAVQLRRFYSRYHGLDADAALARLLRGRLQSPGRLAMILRATRPTLEFEPFAVAMTRYFSMRRAPALGDRELERLYREHAPERFDLVDQALIAGVHPLELWTVAFLRERPHAGEAEMQEAAADARLAAYRWLFDTELESMRERAIASELEVDAFAELHARWQRLGYPIGSLLPSYATAIGRSADRPSALAELAGIIINDGVRQPNRRLSELRPAEETAPEGAVGPERADSGRVMHAEVAAALRSLLVESVELGTARHARVQLVGEDGWPMAIGGKTGTSDLGGVRDGDVRELPAEQGASRSAAFVFTIGERFYGVITAYVRGEEAERYRFTSALTAQVFRSLAPVLEPLMATPSAPADERRRTLTALPDPTG